MKKISLLAMCLLLLLSVSTTSPLFARAQISSPIFKITLMVPQPNPARQSWSLVIQNNLQSLGIDAGRVVLDWPVIYDRALQPLDPNVLGKSYDNGGFDVLFVGYGLLIDPDPWSLYHTSQFAPAGQNYYLWNNTQNDQLTVQIKENVNKTQRLNLVKQWQALAFEELPSITILYTKEIVAFDTTMPNAKQVFQTYHFPVWPPVEHLSGPVDGSIILAQTGPAPSEGLIPLLSTSYYDGTVFGPLYNALAQRNDTIFKNMIPALATGWTVAPDQKTWTVTLRQGVKWHDNANFDANDVKFTFDAAQNDTLPSSLTSFYKGIIGGKNNVTVVDPYTVRFDLPTPYAYFVENILSTAILPQHILGSIPYANWKTSTFNTGGSPGPVGTGPYKWVSYDSLTQTSHLTRNDNYFDFPDDGKAALTGRGEFAVKEYYVRFMSGSDAAITAIQTGAVNVLDSQYHLETQPSFLTDWGSTKLAIYDAFGVQEMGVNMKHPILGTGVDTPLGKSDNSKAALAAKYVRQAISHAVPRDLMIQQLLHEYGNPGITTPVVGNPATGFAVTEGFNTALQPYSFNLTKSRELLQLAGYFPTTATAATFWEAYGIYIVGALVAAIVAISALFYLRTHRRIPSGQQTVSSPS